jgi:hypothetical protein
MISSFEGEREGRVEGPEFRLFHRPEVDALRGRDCKPSRVL